jgi:hypothetical protein
MHAALYLVVLSAAVATASMTLAKSKVAKPLQSWAQAHAPQMVNDLLHCPYCLAHWFSAFFVIPMNYDQPVLDVIALWLAVVAFATLIFGLMMKWVLIQEGEMAMLRKRLDAFRLRDIAQAELAAARACATTLEDLNK